VKVLPRNKRPSRSDIQARVKALWILLVQLLGWKTAYPSQLSGRPASAVAVARAMGSSAHAAMESRSAPGRQGAQGIALSDLRRIHDLTGVVRRCSSPRPGEAFAVADLVAVMRMGRASRANMARRRCTAQSQDGVVSESLSA